MKWQDEAQQLLSSLIAHIPNVAKPSWMVLSTEEEIFYQQYTRILELVRLGLEAEKEQDEPDGPFFMLEYPNQLFVLGIKINGHVEFTLNLFDSSRNLVGKTATVLNKYIWQWHQAQLEQGK